MKLWEVLAIAGSLGVAYYFVHRRHADSWSCRPGAHCVRDKDGSWIEDYSNGMTAHKNPPDNLKSLVVIHEADSYTTYGTPGTKWPDYGVAGVWEPL